MKCKHSPLCFITTALVVIGGLNWGLVGLGGFLGKNLTVVNLLLGRWPQVEWVVYILVGVAAIATVGAISKYGDGCCNNKEGGAM